MTEVFDVVQVGYGPVGQCLAALLGQAGHRVAVLERRSALHDQPRAAAVDHEVMRIFQSLGLAGAMELVTKPVMHHELVNGDGVKLGEIPHARQAVSGFFESYLIYQPHVEAILDEYVARQPTVERRFNCEVSGLSQSAEHGEVTFRAGGDGQEQTVAGRYVIGVDGANSSVRRLTGIERRPFGEARPVLVVDVRPHDLDLDWGGAFDFRQVADPHRSRFYGRWLGREHIRLEFSVLDGDDAQALTTPDRCWELLAPTGLTPDNAEIVRATIYTFDAQIAEPWRRSRVLLAGDAAHVMPPFMAQGLCSGLRDALNLAWKLDLVLRGVTSDALLDTYDTERRPHAQFFTEMSVAIGQMLMTTNPELAAQRDAAIMEHGIPASSPPVLQDGLLQRDTQGAITAPIGQLSPQGRIAVDGRVGRFDDLYGRGWHLLTRRALPARARDGYEEILSALDVDVVHVTPARLPGAAIDLDGVYDEWFSTAGVTAILVRPDFYIFGATRDVDQIPEVLDALRAQSQCLPEPLPLT